MKKLLSIVKEYSAKRLSITHQSNLSFLDTTNIFCKIPTHNSVCVQAICCTVSQADPTSMLHKFPTNIIIFTLALMACLSNARISFFKESASGLPSSTFVPIRFRE